MQHKVKTDTTSGVSRLITKGLMMLISIQVALSSSFYGAAYAQDGERERRGGRDRQKEDGRRGEEERRRADQEKRRGDEDRKQAEENRRNEEGQRRRADEERKRAEDDGRKRAEEDGRRRAEEENRRNEEGQRRRADEERKRADENRRNEEGQRRADEERKRAEEDGRRRAEEENRRNEEGQRRRADEERKRADENRRNQDGQRRADEERKRAEEDGRRRAEEENRRNEEGRRRADEERKRAEEDGRRRTDEEKRRREEDRRPPVEGRPDEEKRRSDEERKRADEERKRAEEDGRRRTDEEKRRSEEDRRPPVEGRPDEGRRPNDESRRNEDRKRRNDLRDRRREEAEEGRRSGSREESRKHQERRAEESRRERNRRVAERDERRRNEDSEARRRRDHLDNERRNHRGHVRDRLERENRHVSDGRRWDSRDRSRWDHRRSRWDHDYYRPLPPPIPREIIELPIPYPDYNDGYWDQYEIGLMADIVEQLSFELYYLAKAELTGQTEWSEQTLTQMFDIVYASSVYSRAVENSNNVYLDTLYELFYLEDAVKIASANVLCGSLSPRIRDNFAELKYYIAELLWQYRIDPAYGSLLYSPLGLSSQPNLSMRPSILNFASLSFDEEILTCESYSFRWAKPHDEITWSVAEENNQIYADSIVIRSLGTGGLKGKNGIAGISSLYVVYEDGRVEDLVAKAIQIRDPHVRESTGQLRLFTEADVITIAIDSNRAIDRIHMKADSWIAPDKNADLSISLMRDKEFESPLLTRP